MDPGIGRSRGIGRGGLADPSCAAQAVFRDRPRQSSWILASSAAEGLGEADSWTRRAWAFWNSTIMESGLW